MPDASTPPAAESEAKAADAQTAEQAAAAEAQAAPAPAAEAKDAEADKPLQPIIIKKIIADDHHGAHGGAWKIALADMMTAMMAFFLLMWLLGATNTDQRKGISDYFKPSTAVKSAIEVNQTSGSNGIMGGQSIIDDQSLPRQATQTGLMQILVPRDNTGSKDSDKSLSDIDKAKIANEVDQANFEKLEQELKEKLAQNKELEKLKDQVQFVREKEGLRIDVIDKADFSMFGLGGAQMSPRAQALMEEIAKSLKDMPNKVKVRGHTDATPFQGGSARNNWSLSAERAEATRQVLAKSGVNDSRFSRIEGVADREPFNGKDPRDPRNRRMSITVQYQE